MRQFLKRNPETGRLAELSNEFHVPEAVCISFTKIRNNKKMNLIKQVHFFIIYFPTLIRLIARCNAILARRSWSISVCLVLLRFHVLHEV